MAQCPYCQKHVADNQARCPHCFTLLESAGTAGTTRGRPRPQRIKGRSALSIKPATLLRLPASRLALLGCLGLVGLLLVAALILIVVAPQTARALFLGTPTPLPPTPRPTATPTPPPTATPEWTTYRGRRDSFSIAFPPDWIVLDFENPGWKRTFRDLSGDFPWLKEILTEEKLQEEEDAASLWAFDPEEAGDFSVRCRLDRELAGLSADEIRETVRAQLLQIPRELGGSSPSGARTQTIQIDGRPAVASELIVHPGADSDFDRPITLQFYLLADEKQGYWIEVMRVDDESAENDRIVQALVDSFHRLKESP